MDVSVLTWLLGLGVTVGIALLGFFWKWMDKQFDRLHQRINHTEERQEEIRAELSRDLEGLRKELYRDFVRRGDHIALVATIRKDFQVVFKLLGNLREQVAKISGKEEVKSDNKA
ncbi:MAG: hypothetical protein RPU13_07600 [Candidatus Sedimenticola sp. (ex Thyasira tokunagai)]